MFKLRTLKIKDSHFIILITLLTIVVHIYGSVDTSDCCSDDAESCLSELDNTSFYDSISSGVCFVLFYVEDSEPCDKEMFRLNYIAQEYGKKISFFKIDVEKYPECCDYCNISGVPSILIFNDGREKRRILGVVSKRNMRIISDRYAKL